MGEPDTAVPQTAKQSPLHPAATPASMRELSRTGVDFQVLNEVYGLVQSIQNAATMVPELVPAQFHKERTVPTNTPTSIAGFFQPNCNVKRSEFQPPGDLG